MRGSKVLSWVVLGAITAAVVAMLGLVMYQQGVTAHDSRMQQAEITALQAGLDEANARLEAGGEQPVPVPSVDPGGDAPVVPIAPTQAQILSAFDVWCDLESCHGSDGKNGRDAPPMTRQQIFTGFSEWCSTDPRCIGVPGTNGSDGADSTVPGPAGRPPTAEEVLAAVEVVCANDACDGKDGTNGTNGKDGRGFVDVECLSTGDWVFTLDDGTALTATGPCRAAQPSPEPSPTATTTKGR